MISLSEKGKITDLQGNLLTSSQQSVQNWTPAGTRNVDLSYANEVNHFRFGGITASQIIYKVTHEVGWQNVSMNDDATNRAKVNQIITAWQTSGKNLIVARVYFGDTRDYDVSFFVPTDDNYSFDSYSVTMTNGTIYRLSSYGSGSDWHSDKITTGQATYSSTNLLIQFGKADDYESVDNTYTTFFNVDALAPIDAERVIDVLNTTLPFTSIGYTLAKNTSNISNVNDLLTVWKAHTDFKLLAVIYNNGAFMSLDLFTGNISISSSKVHFDKLRYEKMLDGSWSTKDYIAKGTDFGRNSAAVTANEFGLFSSFEATYALPRNISYLLSFLTRSTTGFTKDASVHDITLTNGNNTYTLEINPTASQVYQDRNLLFIPTAASCSLKLDLSGMQGSGIEIDVKDIGVYEIGGEA